MSRYTTPDFQQFFPVVWTIVRQIPPGIVSTYGQIATMIPPFAGADPEDYKRLSPRWVGDAMNAVSFRDLDGQPVSPGVPWWRVINARGGISLPAGSHAALEQRRRLLAEGLQFEGDTVALGIFGWNGPDDSWLTANQLLKPAPLRKPPAATQLSLFE